MPKSHVIRTFYKNLLVKRIDRKIITYLIFVVIASVFWFINKVGNKFSTTIDYPVTYVNLPNKKVLVTDLPESLHLSINAYGYDILRYRFGPKPYPIIIDVQRFGIDLNKPRYNQYQLTTRNIRENINSQISNEIKIIDIIPDTIFFQFSHMVEKKVPIKSGFKLEFAKQCMLEKDVVFKPDFVTVSGPSSIVDTLEYVYTKPLLISGIDQTVQKSIELQENKKLQLSQNKVVALISVAKLTEVSFELLVIPFNVPDSLKMITFPGTIKLSCLVPFNRYSLTHASDFIVQVNYNDIGNQLGMKLPLVLGNSPSQAKNISFSPQSVEFILEKRK